MSAEWPAPLDAVALIGPIGDIVSTIGPETESDPAALVLGFIAAFGNVVGRGPHFRVENTAHHLNLYAVLVGQSAKGRKGTAWDNDVAILERVDPDWVAKQLKSGLSSGEGLIAAAANASDRRLFFLEEEFTHLLRVMSRRSNTLSTIARRGWDGKPLQIVTKTNPLLVEDAHISLLGHTSLADLERFLDTTDIVNGFANRVLWVCTKRSKLLPFGGCVSDAKIARIVKQIKAARELASRVREIEFTEKAAELWSNKYAELTSDRPGLVGAATSRAEAQTRRIAAVYALLDSQRKVYGRHLQAALEVWRYCEQSAKFIFNRREPSFDNEILKRLRQSGKTGVTRTELSNAFCRHRSGFEIGGALERLKNSGSATFRKVTTNGRSAERWFAK